MFFRYTKLRKQWQRSCRVERYSTMYVRARTVFHDIRAQIPCMKLCCMFQGMYWHEGDIASVVDEDSGDVFYVQLRGFLQDQYCEKSAVITWLIPTTASPPRGFDADTFIYGTHPILQAICCCFRFVFYCRFFARQVPVKSCRVPWICSSSSVAHRSTTSARNPPPTSSTHPNLISQSCQPHLDRKSCVHLFPVRRNATSVT